MILAQLGGIFCTVLFLGGSILVHELGHYWAARRLGFSIPRFSIGFGPRLFSWKCHETEFRISAIPIGGYVALPQMEIGGDDDPPRRIHCWEKCCAAALGPLANLAFAFALAVALWILGQPVPSGELDRTVGALSPALAEIWASESDSVLREGDRIGAVDGVPLARLSDLALRVALGTEVDGKGQPVARLRVERGGQVLDLAVPVLRRAIPGDPARPLRSLPLFPAQPAVVESVLPRSPAERAGLLPGDEILACGGFIVHSPAQLQQILARHSGEEPIPLALRRGGAPRTVQILPAAAVETAGHLRAQRGKKIVLFLPGEEPGTWQPASSNGERPWMRAEVEAIFPSVEEVPPQIRPTIGVALAQTHTLERVNPFRAVGRCAGETAHTLLALFSPRSEVGVRHLMGVAGMARTLHRLSLDDFRGLLHFALAINVGLALLNLLPIPVLDGGHVALAIGEKILGRPLPSRPVSWLHGCCLLLLFTLLAYVTALDLLRWRGDRHAQSLLRDLTALQRTPQF